MPYIKKEDRNKLKDYINNEVQGPENAGQLNFIFTKIILDYISKKGQNYQNYNDIIGALECCKIELYRRSIGPYEDIKITENGDVTKNS